MNHKTRTVCVWFLSLNTIILRFICAILCNNSPPLSQGTTGSMVWMYPSPCIFHLLMDIQVASSFCRLHIDLVWTFVYKCACRLSFLINIWEYSGGVLILSVCWILEETLELFSFFYFFNLLLSFHLFIYFLNCFLKGLHRCTSPCMPSRFSCVRLFATPRTVALPAPLFVGFPRQEYWTGSHALLGLQPRESAL